MESKYYIPELSEFYVGFEYEEYDASWQPAILDFRDLDVIDDEIREGVIRVKYLDREDIESLGWKFIKEGDDFFTQALIFKLTKEVGFNTGITYILIRYASESPMVLSWVNFSSYQREAGSLSLIIKNKSELKVLMRQLEIESISNKIEP